MRNILEQAVIHHLNGDAEKAQELFHQFIVTRARQIHESMRNGEEPLNENWDEETDEVTEEYFGEDDLSTLEDGGEDDLGADDLGGDVEGDDFGDETDEASEEIADDLGAEEDDLADLGDEDGDIETRIDDLEAKLDELVAKFDDGNDFADDEGDDLDDAASLDDDMADDNGSEAADDEAATDEFSAEDEFGGEEEDEFKGLGESIASELEKITMKNDPATEIGDGGKITQNDKSGLPQKNAAARQGGSPVHLKSSTHKGFEREAAPAVTTQKPRRNNVPKADAALSGVAAPSNKKEATEVGASGKKVSTQTKSPVISAKGVQK